MRRSAPAGDASGKANEKTGGRPPARGRIASGAVAAGRALSAPHGGPPHRQPVRHGPSAIGRAPMIRTTTPPLRRILTRLPGREPGDDPKNRQAGRPNPRASRRTAASSPFRDAPRTDAYRTRPASRKQLLAAHNSPQCLTSMTLDVSPKNKASLFQTFSSRFTYYAACTNKAKRGISHGHREQACAGREADSM